MNLWVSGCGDRHKNTSMNILRQLYGRLTEVAQLAIILVTLGGLTASIVTYNTLDDALQWATHTRIVIGRIDETRISILSAHVRLRNYLACGQQEDLDEMLKAQRETKLLLQECASMTADNQDQQANFAKLASIVDDRMLLMGELVKVKQDGGDVQAALLSSRLAIPQAREQFLICKAEEIKLLQIREVHAENIKKRYLVIIVLVGVVDIVLAIFGAMANFTDREPEKLECQPESGLIRLPCN